MKFLMSKVELSDLVTGVQNVVALKAPMPVLSNILLETNQNEIVITATDLTVGVRAKANAKIIEPGSTTLPARKLAQLLRELNIAYIEVSTNAKEVAQITADTASFRMNGLPAIDFPTLPDLIGAQKVAISGKDLKEALFNTSFAAAKEDSRYVLTGVMLTVSEKVALFVGTDGKRLARTAVSVDCPEETAFECIIPSKAVDEIVKRLSDSEEKVSLSVLQDKIAVEFHNHTVVSKLLFGDFPDIDRVIPRNLTHVIAVNKEELSLLLRQVSLFVSESNQSARFTFDEGSLFLSANAVDVGDGKVNMSISYSGPRLDIAFNPLSFLDILRHMRGDYVYLGLQDAFNPAVVSDKELKKVLEELPSPLYIMMPMRLSEE